MKLKIFFAFVCAFLFSNLAVAQGTANQVQGMGWKPAGFNPFASLTKEQLNQLTPIGQRCRSKISSKYEDYAHLDEISDEQFLFTLLRTTKKEIENYLACIGAVQIRDGAHVLQSLDSKKNFYSAGLDASNFSNVYMIPKIVEVESLNSAEEAIMKLPKKFTEYVERDQNNNIVNLKVLNAEGKESAEATLGKIQYLLNTQRPTLITNRDIWFLQENGIKFAHKVLDKLASMSKSQNDKNYRFYKNWAGELLVYASEYVTLGRDAIQLAKKVCENCGVKEVRYTQKIGDYNGLMGICENYQVTQVEFLTQDIESAKRKCQQIDGHVCDSCYDFSIIQPVADYMFFKDLQSESDVYLGTLYLH